MKNKNAQQLLRNPEEAPTDKLFKNILDKSIYEMMKKIDQIFITTEIGFEWRYYTDGKAWLGKATYKKKTVVWISVWENSIKASFYFTGKTRPGVLKLGFNEEIKSSFNNREPIGKLIPLTIDIKDEKSLHDFSVLLNYKKNLR